MAKKVQQRTTAAAPKAPVAEEMLPIQEMATANESATYSEEQVQAMIAKAVADAMKSAVVEEKPQAASVPATTDVVTMRFADEVNDNNEIYLGKDGKYGHIIGKRWTGQVPKMAFIGDFRTPLIQTLLKNRNLIVIDGLTDEERRLYGVMYSDGEFIDEKLYDRMLRMDEESLVALYKGLCPEWRRMLAVRFAEAYDTKKLRVTRDALLALNKISRKDNKDLPKDDIRRKGAFWALIQKFNFADETDMEDEE
jgi:hypothetical protein